MAIVAQWTEFQVGLVADRALGGNAERLALFYGQLNFTLGLVAFLLQFATGPTLRRCGVGLGILCLPLAIGAGSVLILLFPTIVAVVVTKGLDQSLRSSIDKASYELLYVPIDALLRWGARRRSMSSSVARLTWPARFCCFSSPVRFLPPARGSSCGARRP